jgi:hypothetical protein
MRMAVVGGNSRNIGKTSVVAALISALRHRRWTAIKLTQYGHGVCSADGQECGCAPAEHPFAITAETDPSGATDTSRFLAAGACRALWVRVRQGALETVLPALGQAIAQDENVIIESNSILRFWRPDVYLTVLDPIRKDFKSSAREFLERADACLVLEPGLERQVWEGISPGVFRTKTVFPMRRDCTVTPDVAAFVEARLAGAENAPPVCYTRAGLPA